MNLTKERTLDDIEEWFQVGKITKTQTLQKAGVQAGRLRGRLLNPKTQDIYLQKKVDSDQFHPAYRRKNDAASAEKERLYESYIRQGKENAQMDLCQAEGSVDDLLNDMEKLELESTLCGNAAMPEDLIPEDATAVYDTYSFQHEYDPKLPITRKAEEVILTIESNQVTVIQGSTGSGKTTQVPQFILDHYASRGEYCNIVVTQPRRIAAISIAKRVCQERDWPLGSICGYQIGMDSKVSEDTRLVYCTTGVLREKLIGNKNMHKFTHVILDEVHERDQESDFALLVVRKLLRTNSHHVKVIIMSATMNSDQFSRYFSQPIRNVMEPAPVVSVEGQVFKVAQFFVDDLALLGKLPPFSDCTPTLHPEVVNIAVQLIREFDVLESKEQKIDPSTGFTPSRGTVLMFLPGIQEIKKVLDQIREIEVKHNLKVIPLHSTITIDEQTNVFEKPAKGYRKVILSTNIAESSITVPDIKYVIDFCLTKNLVCDLDTNYTHLQLEWASKSNCTQRKGRAGRVSQGRAYFMLPKKFYEQILEDHCTPEIQRCPLESLVLKVKLLDMGEPIALLSQALSPPNLNNIERTILSLKQVGALCMTLNRKVSRFDGDLTFVGRVLAELPVDIRIGKLMILGYVFGLLEEAIIIGAALSLKSVFATPFQSRFEAFTHKYQWASGSMSDCQSILHAYKVWEKCKEMQEFSRSGRTERQWGEKHYIQTKRINEVRELVRELRMRLEKFNLIRVQPRPEHFQRGPPVKDQGEMSPTDSLFLKIMLCGAFYPNYFTMKEPGAEREMLKELSGHDPLNTVMVKGLPRDQGLLYRDRMIDMFSMCCQHGVKPVIHLEGSKAFIQFPKQNRDLSEPKFRMLVNPSVGFAIKLRQLRVPLKLEMCSMEEAEKAKSLLMKAAEQVSSQGFLSTNRVRGDNPADSNNGNKQKTVMPDCHETVVEVVITEVVHCGHFFAQMKTQETNTHLHNIMTMLNPGSKLSHLTKTVRGAMCAAPFFEEQEAYYRARIEKIENQTMLIRNVPTHVRLAQVFFVDYGNLEHVPVERLCVLPPEAVEIPWLAMECELKEIRPSSVKCPDGFWTREADDFFRMFTLYKMFLAEVYSVVSDVMRVELVQCSHGGQEMSVNEHLVTVGFADRMEENHQSKQNHSLRLMEANDQASASVSTSLYIDVKIPKSKNRRIGKMINLVGPSHPLEMEFYSCTHSGQHSPVYIDPESINSVAVNAEPQYKFLRMMVAASVGLNADGTTIVARDTTIMPQIPGIQAIACLLFCPVAEFRLDKKRQRYIGALCGLGSDPEYPKYALLPDHDIELTFDVDLTNEDVDLINNIRHAINLALGSRTNMAEWGPDAVAAKIQRPARERLLQLLRKKREYKEPEYFPAEYYWNQLNPAEVISHEEDFSTDSLSFLPPHPTVYFTEEVTSNEEKRRQHIDELHKIANTHSKGPITCELCNMTMMSAQLLAVHLHTERHQRRENKILEQCSDK